VIARPEDEGRLFYVVLQGSVQFAVRNAAGHELTVDEIGPGGYFGELSLLTGEPRAARVQAVTEVHTLALDQREFFAFLESHPPAAIDVLKVLGQRLHRSNTLLRQSVSKNVNDLDDERTTFGQRIADMIADFSGSIPFLIGNAAWFGG
jgi:CRP/FNR family transcriptional regulator, cyclic AMP receptor protein